MLRVPPKTKSRHGAAAWIAGFDDPNNIVRFRKLEKFGFQTSTARDLSFKLRGAFLTKIP